MAERFKANGKYHLIDDAGNHFVNGRCVNPKLKQGELSGQLGENFKGREVIGSTYPKKEDRQYFKVLGHIPLEEIPKGSGKLFVKRGFEHLISKA